MTATSWPVMWLLAKARALHDKGYDLYADNWFTGIPSVRVAMAAGIDYMGTARSDRLGGAWTKEEKKRDKGVEEGAVQGEVDNHRGKEGVGDPVAR